MVPNLAEWSPVIQNKLNSGNSFYDSGTEASASILKLKFINIFCLKINYLLQIYLSHSKL